MKIIYGICYYYDRHKHNNILRHYESFLKFISLYPLFDFHFCINVMMDESDPTKRISVCDSLQKEISQLQNHSITLLHDFNANGTIQGLDNTYHFVKEKGWEDSYIMFFEEDFYTINFDILQDSIQLLTSNIIYVGENTNGKVKIETNRENARVKVAELEVWTDVGFYFSSFQNFETIEKTIGVFHIGNKTQRYTHAIDGIDFGEVGFPTRLYHAGLRFTSVHRNKYFIHSE